jgi:hypothetical protein
LVKLDELELIQRPLIEDSVGPEYLLEVDDLLVLQPVFLNLLVREQELSHINLQFVTHSEAILVFGKDIHVHLYSILNHYPPVFFFSLLDVTPPLVLEGPRDVLRQSERERMAILPSWHLLVAELESHNFVIKERDAFHSDSLFLFLGYLLFG